MLKRLEQVTGLLTDPDSPFEVLIKREFSVSKNGDQYSFHLNGGNLIFHRIHELDSQFWRIILESSKQADLLSISEIHLAADCNRELMGNVSASIKKGHYECKGCRAYGFYWLNNEKKEGPVGKRSSDFASFKDQRFECETVYFGCTRMQRFSVVFYNKELEQRNRKSALSNYLMRVELRINFAPQFGVSKVLAENLLTSYLIQKGNIYRTKVFLYLVTQTIRFSTHFHDHGELDVAPWWKYQFIMPLIHASIQKGQINYEWPEKWISDLNVYLPLSAVTSEVSSEVASEVASEVKPKRGRPNKSTPSNPVPKVKPKRGRPKKDLTL